MTLVPTYFRVTLDTGTANLTNSAQAITDAPDAFPLGADALVTDNQMQYLIDHGDGSDGPILASLDDSEVSHPFFPAYVVGRVPAQFDGNGDSIPIPSWVSPNIDPRNDPAYLTVDSGGGGGDDPDPPSGIPYWIRKTFGRGHSRFKRQDTVTPPDPPATPTFVNGVGAGEDAASPHSITVPVPSDVQDGDLMLAVIGYGGVEASCDGWTPVAMGGAFFATVLSRVASSEPTDYTFDGDIGFMQGAIVAYRGVSSVDANSNAITSPPSPMGTESVTALHDGLYLAIMFGQDSGTTPHYSVTGGTLTLDYEFAYTPLATSIGFFSKPIAAPGATGADSYTTPGDSSDGVVVFSLAVS